MNNEQQPYSVFSSTMGKNINVYWMGATALAIWFLFIHAPRYLRTRNILADAPFLFHLIGAYSIYLTCIVNTLVTPSIQRSLHVWTGRIGMILGVFGFLSGVYLCYWPWREALPPLDFSIGITIGGISQMLLQAHGYFKIKKFQQLRDKQSLLLSTRREDRNSNAGSKESAGLLLNSQDEDPSEMEQQKNQALKDHISSMIALFMIACGVPAAIRVAGLLGAGGNAALVSLVVLFGVFSNFYAKKIIKRVQ